MKNILTFLLFSFQTICLAQSWSPVSTQGDIPGIANADIIHHPGQNAVYLFGGRTNSGFQNDIWKLDLENLNWSLVPTSEPKPVPRHTHNCVFDEVNNRMLVFSGQGSGLYNDVWSFDFATSTWEELSPNGNVEGVPQKRYGTITVFEPQDNNLITFGGFGNAGTGRHNDTWSFNSSTNEWTNLDPLNPPKKRCLHNGTYIPEKKTMIMYGGQSSGNQDDIWSFNLETQTWTEFFPEVIPPGRHFCSITAVDANTLWMFGGNGSGQNNFSGARNDLWQFSLVDNSWTEITNENSPAARVGHIAVHIPNRNGVLVFGGNASDGSFLNDTWLLEDEVSSTQTVASNFTFRMLSANPIKDDVRFEIEVIENSDLTFVIMDEVGRLSVAINETTYPAGNHLLEFTLNNELTSGLYYLAVKSKDQQEVLSKLIKP